MFYLLSVRFDKIVAFMAFSTYSQDIRYDIKDCSSNRIDWQYPVLPPWWEGHDGRIWIMVRGGEDQRGCRSYNGRSEIYS